MALGGAAPAEDPVARAARAAYGAQYPLPPGAPAPQVGAPVRVARLDRGGHYLLVPLRDALGRHGLVQMDAGTLAVESVAAVADGEVLHLLSAGEALALAQAAFPAHRQWQPPELGWRPCRESYSSLMPLWVVGHGQGRVYVTQAGRVFTQPSWGRGGG